jgi:predicted ribosomally synthesized peptide with SipW-like signal peptide
MNKKVLYSMLLVAAVAGAAFAGTFAFFNATQTVEDTTFVSGTLDLSVDGGEFINESINVGNMGSSGNYTMAGEKEWTITNTGTMAGRLYLELENIENINRGCNEPKSRLQ